MCGVILPGPTISGTNENTNGLLRQFFPKGMDFGTIIQLDVDIALEILNRPRKTIGPRQRSSGANLCVALQIKIWERIIHIIICNKIYKVLFQGSVSTSRMKALCRP